MVRPTPRLIHSFRQKPFWMRSGPAAAFASAKPRLGRLGDWPSTNRAGKGHQTNSGFSARGTTPCATDLWEELNPASQGFAAAIRPLQIPSRPSLHCDQPFIGSLRWYGRKSVRFAIAEHRIRQAFSGIPSSGSAAISARKLDRQKTGFSLREPLAATALDPARLDSRFAQPVPQQLMS